MDITILILRHRAKLERMIEKQEDYNKILKQSQKLDYYINKKMAEKY